MSDALQAIIIVGRVMRDKVIPPTKDVDLGNPNTFNKMPSANKPNTMDGTAARLLILISIISVILFLGANSSRYTAASNAIGKAKIKQIIIEKKEPIIDPATPATSASLESPLVKK